MEQPFGTIFGPRGEQFKTYSATAKSAPPYQLGQELKINERVWRFCRAGATALVAGKLYQMELPDGNFDTLAVPASALNVVGSRKLRVTLPANAIIKDLWKDGYALIEANAGASEGEMYQVSTHPLSAGSEDVTFELYDALQVALNTSDKVTFWKNPYADVIVHPSPPTAKVAGVPSIAIAAGAYGWLQVQGPCNVLADGTIVINQQVVASPSVDGAVSNALLTEATPNTFIQPIVGICIEVPPTTDYGGIWLQLA